MNPDNPLDSLTGTRVTRRSSWALIWSEIFPPSVAQDWLADSVKTRASGTSGSN